MGQEVATLVNDLQTAGAYEQAFDTKANNLVNGTYVYRLQVGDYTQTKVMNVVK